MSGHIGYPWTDEMWTVAWKQANVHIDTSTWAPRYYPAQLRAITAIIELRPSQQAARNAVSFTAGVM